MPGICTRLQRCGRRRGGWSCDGPDAAPPNLCPLLAYGHHHRLLYLPWLVLAPPAVAMAVVYGLAYTLMTSLLTDHSVKGDFRSYRLYNVSRCVQSRLLNLHQNSIRCGSLRAAHSRYLTGYATSNRERLCDFQHMGASRKIDVSCILLPFVHTKGSHWSQIIHLYRRT